MIEPARQLTAARPAGRNSRRPIAPAETRAEGIARVRAHARPDCYPTDEDHEEAMTAAFGWCSSSAADQRHYERTGVIVE